MAIAKLLHLGAVFTYMLGIIYELFVIQWTGDAVRYGGRAKYFTFINEVIQLTFFTLSVINDFVGSNVDRHLRNAKCSMWQKLRDFWFAAVATPAGLFVVVTFWPIYAFNRELVYPKKLDMIVPTWLNHIWHSSVIVFLMLEMKMYRHRYPSRTVGIATAICVAVSYQLWLLYVAVHAQIWAYGILKYSNWIVRLTFLAAWWPMMAVCYIAGEYCSGLMWGSATKKSVAKHIKAA